MNGQEEEDFVTVRPTQREGFQRAWRRFRKNVLALTRDRVWYTLRERREAKADLLHSFANIHVEAVREIFPSPRWLPKWIGKGIIALEVAFVLWVILVNV